MKGHETTSPKLDERAATLADIRTFVTEMLAKGDSENAVELLLSLLEKLQDENSNLALQVRQLMRDRYGRRSEKIDAAQLELLLETARAEDQEAASKVDELPLPKPEPKPAAAPKRKGNGRGPLPDNLPRKVEVLEPPAAERVCEKCGADKVCIGHETSELLEFVPASFFIIEQRRAKYACKPCGDGVVIAPVGPKPIERGRPGSGLLAHVAVSKYQDHLPLNRLISIYKRHGVTLASATLTNWIAAVATAFEPIYRELIRRVLAAELLGVDDTQLRVLDKDHARGSKRGHLWSYIGYEEGRPIRAVFDYTPDWKGIGPRTFLKDRRGYIQGDGYKGIDELFKGEDSAVCRVGCWAHVRRKFVDAHKAGDLRAAVAVKLIGKLYEVERIAQERNASVDERFDLRDEFSRPIATELANWITRVYKQVAPKSPLGKALTYAVNQWQTLLVYLKDGVVLIDNNEVERRIRAVAVGRKNYLFAGSDAGGERAAVIYSVLASCSLAGVEPLAYTRDVLDRLARDWPASRLAELLPENWEPTVAPTDAAPEPSPAA